MPQFQTVEQAFEWFLEHTFPKLSPEQKLKVRDAKHDYTTGRSSVSHKRMIRIMNLYGDFNTHYTYNDSV